MAARHADKRNKEVTLKNCAPFMVCNSKANKFLAMLHR